MNNPHFRIALVGPLPPPSGGMANQTAQLAELLHKEGIKVEVVQVNPPYRPSFIMRVKGIRAFFRLLPYLIRLWRAAGRSDLFHVMANSGWSWHFFAAPAIQVAKFRGKGVVVNYHGGEAEKFFAQASASVFTHLKKADVIIVPSAFLAQVFARYGLSANIVPNVVDLERFSSNCQSRPAGAHVLVARNLEPLYDNKSALRAFALVLRKLPSARLTIAGSGQEKEALQKMAEDLGIDRAVAFAGRIENSNMPVLYRSADVMLNPSLADNMPISILESLACGVPVVSTDVGGIPFLVENETTALLVHPGDHEAMAQACLRLLSDRELAARLSEAGRKRVREFEWKHVRRALFGFYYQVLGTGAGD